MLKVKGLSLQRGLPITFLHKFLPVVMAFFQDSTFACLALFPPGQSRPRRMYGNLLSCILVKRHSFSPYVQPFRAWTGGGGREAGSWQSDALQSHEHDIPTYAGISGTRATLIDDKGNLNQSNITLDVGRFYTYPTGPSGRIAAESRPVNISVPAILYLGLPA